MKPGIYLDNNSTTPLDPLVLEAMLPYFTRAYGNPSNTTHEYGVEAADAVEQARSQVAVLIGARPKQIVFTSGATESNNLGILGAVRRNRDRGDHVITVATEHKAVLLPCKQLEHEGISVTYLAVDRHGRVDAQAVEEAITDQTLLVSVMMANNEVGTVQPVTQIGSVCKERGILFHSDAAQAVGRIPVDVEEKTQMGYLFASSAFQSSSALTASPNEFDLFAETFPKCTFAESWASRTPRFTESKRLNRM